MEHDGSFLSHASHRALAAWALGADADTIRNAYERDCEYEKPAIKSPQPISVGNFSEHLGDDRYFNAYMQFFVHHVKEQGIGPTIEEFVFARKANLGEAGEGQPEMLNRFFAGVLHPAIHTGYSAEFSLPGMLVEGLAQAAVHSSVPGLLEPLLLFEDSLIDLLSKASLPSSQITTPTPVNQTANKSSKKDDPHALTILARVLCDPKFRPSPEDRNDSGYQETINQHSEDIASYVNAWNIDPAILEDGGWEKKVEEIVWAVVVLYGIAGWTHGESKQGGFHADFFFMHLITSSIFLPSLCAFISPVSRYRLLKTYLAVSCVWAVARGQPTLDVKGFIEATKGSANTGKGDLWDKIVGEARVHRDEHVTKIIRSLAGWASVFGTRRARASSIKEADSLPPTELPGSEYLDGSLFLRVAVLTLRRVSWDIEKPKLQNQAKESAEEEEQEEWDFQGFL